MSMLDAHIPQLVAAQSAFAAKAGLMRSTISQAEQEAVSAQAFHQGESSAAFQAAHARFVEVAARINTLQGLGADIASEQAALSNAWQGDTGLTYQAWQARWNQAMQDLVRAYQSMAGTREANTMAMLARDQAEAAKWGG